MTKLTKYEKETIVLLVLCQEKVGSFLCLLNNISGYDILELSFIPGGYNDAGITHIA